MLMRLPPGYLGLAAIALAQVREYLSQFQNASMMLSIKLTVLIAKMLSGWQHRGVGSWTLTTKECEDEKWGPAVDEGARMSGIHESITLTIR